MNIQTRNITEQSILSTIIKKANSSKGELIWKHEDSLFKKPEAFKFQYFPTHKVVSGKWFKDEKFR